MNKLEIWVNLVPIYNLKTLIAGIKSQKIFPPQKFYQKTIF